MPTTLLENIQAYVLISINVLKKTAPLALWLENDWQYDDVSTGALDTLSVFQDVIHGSLQLLHICST